VNVDMNLMPLKFIGREVHLVLLGYQRILDSKGVETLEGGRN
jgi:hypothetical protein